jgi:hypothetical protein
MCTIVYYEYEYECEIDDEFFWFQYKKYYIL